MKYCLIHSLKNMEYRLIHSLSRDYILLYTLIYSSILFYTLIYSYILLYTLIYSYILLYTLIYSYILLYTLILVETSKKIERSCATNFVGSYVCIFLGWVHTGM